MAERSRIYGFKINRRAEQALANRAAMQGMLARKAGYVQGNAAAALGDTRAYETRQIQGRFAKGFVVSTALGNKATGHVFDDAQDRQDCLRDALGRAGGA